jgi:hypothetical protein
MLEQACRELGLTGAPTEIQAVVLVALMGIGLAYTGARLDGPFGLATWLKGWLLNADWTPAWLHNGLACVLCWSFWMTLLATVLMQGLQSWVLSPESLVQSLVMWLAGFGLACWVFLVTGHG